MAIVAEQACPSILILDCVQDPHNLGAILRTADGAGMHAVVAPKDKAVTPIPRPRVFAEGFLLR